MKSIAILFMSSREAYGQGVSISRPTLPHPLLALGSYLKDRGVKVYLIDEQVCNAKDRLERIIDKVDIIGFSVMTMQISRSLELSDYIKEKYPDKKIIWGGIHCSLLPKQTIKDTFIDYVCVREGEEVLYELCSEVPLNEIKNLVYKKDGKVIINPMREFIDLNELNMPHWELFDMTKYIGDSKIAGKKTGRCLPITAGRGCIFNCAFCVNTILGRKWRALSVGNIIKQIKFLREKYNIQHFNLNDDCFDIDLERIDVFCKTLIKEKINITWDISARAGEHWNDRRMKLIKNAGCTAMSVGVESGSQRILDMIHKPSSVKDVIYTAKKCNKYRITLIPTYMSGFPSETEEELQQTIDLLKKVANICPSLSIHGPQPFKPYPNSELYFEAVKQGFEIPKTLKEWAEASETGFISDSYLPWIKNSKRLRAIEFYCMNSVRSPRNFLQKILVSFSKIRLKYNFWYLPFEIPITKFYVRKFLK